MTLTLAPAYQPAMTAKKMVPHRFREATSDARGWLVDCYGEMLPDGRRTEDLGAVDLWLLIECNYQGGVVQFVRDGNYVVTREQVAAMLQEMLAE